MKSPARPPQDRAVALIGQDGSLGWCSDRFARLLTHLSDGSSVSWSSVAPFADAVERSRRCGDVSRSSASLSTRGGALLELDIECSPGESAEAGDATHALVVDEVHVGDGNEQRLRRSNDELVRFQYHVSHDLAAPIIAARGLLGLIGEDLDAGTLGELPDLVDETVAQLGRLDGLIADLIALSRVETPVSSGEAIDLRELVDDIVESLAPSRRLLELSVSVTCEDPMLTVDRTRLRQVLANLIANANKFRDAEQAAPWIEIDLVHRADGHLLRVDDNGIGMSEAVAARAFDMFSRGEHDRPGHGLGLYIVAQQLERLGGTVRVRSRRDPTSLELWLPRVTAGPSGRR